MSNFPMTKNIELSHIQALTALVQAHDRIAPLEPAAEAWRHEAYKLSIQKKAIEDEALHQVAVANQRLANVRSTIATRLSFALDREIADLMHKISSALMKTELRIDRLEAKIEDRLLRQSRQVEILQAETERLRTENVKLKQEISDSNFRTSETENLKHENLELRRLVADRKIPSADEAPAQSEIGNLLAELKALEAEARKLDFRSK